MKVKTALIILALAFIKSLNAQLDVKFEKLPPVKDSYGYTRSTLIKMTVNATYNGKSIFVRNGFHDNGIGFCITQIKVNENITADEINSMSFKIDLDPHKLKLGEKFKLIIFYKDSCGTFKAPLIMNPGALMASDASGNSVLTIEGTNWNTNLIVTNPRTPKGNYGVKEVLVNGKKVEGINADVFEIACYKMGIKYEEKIKIEFKYESGCDPFLVNEEVIKR